MAMITLARHFTDFCKAASVAVSHACHEIHRRNPLIRSDVALNGDGKIAVFLQKETTSSLRSRPMLQVVVQVVVESEGATAKSDNLQRFVFGQAGDDISSKKRLICKNLSPLLF
jgi:hypothetical protein